jgi:hypothetical protein
MSNVQNFFGHVIKMQRLDEVNLLNSENTRPAGTAGFIWW